MKEAINPADHRNVIHPLYCEILLHIARTYGITERDLASPDELQHLQSRHSPVKFFRFLERFIESCPEPRLAIEFGRQIDLSAAGVIGQAVMSASTVGDSFRLIRRYYPLTGIYFDISCNRHQEEVHVRFDMNYENIPEKVRAFLLEALVNSWASCYRILRGETFSFNQLTFDFKSPTARDYYPNTFGCTFTSPGNGNLLVMNADLLRQKTITRNQAAHARAVAHCESALLKYSCEQSTAQEVRNQLKRAEHLATINLDSIATQMHISSRTLNRRLQVENVRFQELFDEERRLRACRMLQNSPLSTEQIADLLGYSNASNFRRAFKKWTGKNPGIFRQSIAAVP